MNVRMRHIPSIFIHRGRTEEVLNLPREATVADAVREQWKTGHHIVHSRLGRVTSEAFHAPLRDGDEIVVTPEIRGGGGGGVGKIFKGIGKIAAGWFVPIYGVKLFQSGVSDIASALTFAAPKSKPPFSATGAGGNQDLASSATYSWDGIQSQSEAGIPIPIVYGRHRVGGNFINAFVAQHGDNSYLNVLLALGEGPFNKVAGINHDADNVDIDDIEDKILVEGNRIDNYRDAKVFVRLGNDQQAPIHGFDQIHDLYAIDGVKLRKNEGYVRTTSNSDVEEITISFRHAALIAFSNGASQQTTYTAKIYTKPYLANDSTYVLQGTYSRSARSSSEVRGQFTIEDLSPGRYDVKIVQTSNNSNPDKLQADTFVTSFDEIKNMKLSYPGVALLGLKLLATSQLSGTLSDVIVEVEGIKVQVFSDPETSVREWSQNAEFCAYDLLTNSRYGLGPYHDAETINRTRLIDEAAYCDELIARLDDDTKTEKRFLLDLVIDAELTGLDALALIGSTCRGVPIWESGRLSMMIEKPESPTQLFTMGSIIEGSFSKAWDPLKKVPNILEVEFLDHGHQYLREVVDVENEEAIAAGKAILRQSLFLRGCTRENQAIRIGWWSMKSQEILPRTISFKAGINSVLCLPGDVVEVAHDQPEWGISSGRVAPGSTASTIKLTRNVTLNDLPSGEIYVIIVKHTDDTRETREIISPPGDYEAGTAIEVSTNWTSTPAEYDEYSIGRAGIAAKPFRVLSIAVDDNHEATITAREYDERVYSDTPFDFDPIDYSELPDPTAAPEHVSGLVAYSEASYQPEVLVSWVIPAQDNDHGFYARAEVQVSSDGGATYQLWATTSESSAVLLGLSPAVEYTFKVVSVSSRGRHARFEDAPTISFTPRPGIPPNVTGLELKGQGNDNVFRGLDASFTWREPASNTAIHPAGEEPNGAGTGSRNEYIRGYRVAISTGYLNSLGLLGLYEHTAFVTANEFTYFYGQNIADNGGKPRPRFTALVWAEDIYGQISVQPALLAVENRPPPAVTNLTAIRDGIATIDIDGTPIDQEKAVVRFAAEDDYDRQGFFVFYGLLGPGDTPTEATLGDYYLWRFGSDKLFTGPPIHNTMPVTPDWWNPGVSWTFYVAPYDPWKRKAEDLNWTAVALQYPGM